MEPNTATLTTDVVAERVEHMIRVRTAGSIRHLKVVTLSGEVVLEGCASTYYAKQVATHAALDACGDLLVTNDIEVL